MIYKQSKLFVWLFLAMLGMVQTAVAADFKDFSVIVNNQTGTLLTAEEQEQGTAVNFGVAVAADGTVSRVAVDDASAVATVNGKYHSDHGCTNLQVVVPVNGNVKITVGQCTYSTSEIKVTNSAGELVVSKTPVEPSCWKNGHTAVDELYYAGEATTLTISGMSYCPYVAVEATDYVPTKYAISYSLGSETAEGVVPVGAEVTDGETYTIVKNFTLYKEGYTLTGWTDGTTTYATGETITPTSDLALTPVFTANTVTLADRTDAVDVLFTFRRDQGAPTVGYEGVTGIWVTQAMVNGTVIDVKADFSTSPGKFANANWTDWAQMNEGTTWTIPSCKGATVSIEAYNALTTTSIDGQTDYTSGTTISLVIANAAETIDVVIGKDGSYYRYIKVNLPVVENGNVGETFDNVSGSVTWTIGNEENGTAETTIAGALSNSTVAVGSGLKVETATYFDQTMTKYTPTTSNAGNVPGVMIEYRVKPKAGITFQPTNVSFDAVKVGTDGAYFSYSYTTDGKESGVTAVAAATILRNNNANAATAQLNHSVDITADAASEFTFRFYISNTASDKNIALSNIVITGIVNGTVEDVPQYTLTAVAAPEEGGSVNIYPNGGIYEEGSTIKLTATKNFGYKFVNWTNKAGEEVSTDAVYTFDIMADEELTANFQKLNTYELAIVVEGGANDYMVSLSPAPTMVDGKNMYEEGTKVTLTASSNPILTFTNWSNGETASEMAVTMTEDKAFTASYTAIDYIVGWDFIKPGSSGRAADFAAADNDAVSLSLRNAEGDEQGWLDKSQEGAGGYEGRPAAVNWRTGSQNGDVGHYYWQTAVDASAFTDIKIITAMMYNYNAYTTQLVEYSLDGEAWTTVGKIEISGTKNWTDAEFSLPSEANNQPKVYIRWISDKTSKVDGTASANDGIALGASYIIGTAKLVDDGTAPALVSSVPENGATGASANGKIVLTFDEKVKLTENAKATLGNLILTPTASGKTVICEYKGLDYSTDMQFILYGGSVADLTDNVLEEDIIINFQTKVKPVVDKALYDFIVPVDGTITEALAAANKRGANATDRFRIFIADGDYVFDTNGTTTGGDGNTYPDPRSYLTSPYVSIIGQSMEGVTITNQTPEATWNNGYNAACPLEGIGNGDVLIIQKDGHDAYFQNLTMKSSMGDAHGRDVVLQDKSNRTIFKDACLWGYQDTYVSNADNGKYYFEGGVLRGRTDYLCGKGDVYYNGVTLQQCGTGGYLAVPSVPKKYGYVFYDCYIKKETSNVTFYLGRPWGSGTPIACFINTKMDANAIGNGWADMSGGYPKRFAEYNSYLTSGTSIDLSGRRTSWTDGSGNVHANDPILTIDEVNEMSLANVMGQDDDWDPTALTEQASAPTNVNINSASKEMSWDDSNYVLCWVVFKDGKFVTATTVNSYEVDDTSSTWTVRAANEMGGLGEATEASIVTGIEEITDGQATQTNDAIYNMNGMRVKNATHGVYIIGGKKVVVK